MKIFDIIGSKVEINAEQIKEQGFLYLQDLAGDDFEIFCQVDSKYFYIGIPLSKKPANQSIEDFIQYVIERIYVEFPFLGIREVDHLTGTIVETFNSKL